MRWFLIILLVSGVARAEVYRCESGGRVTYTDQPCSETAQPKQLPKLHVVPASEVEKRLAAEHDKKLSAEKKTRDKANKEWLKQHKSKTGDAERLRNARVQGKAVAGMSEDQVRDIYGEPDNVKRTSSGETWTFHHNGRTQTVTFEAGRVKRLTDKKK